MSIFIMELQWMGRRGRKKWKEMGDENKVEKNEGRHKPKRKRMSYKEKLEWESIDENIAWVEEKISFIQEELTKVRSDYVKAQQLAEEEQALNEKLEQFIERWTYLAELAEQESH